MPHEIEQIILSSNMRDEPFENKESADCTFTDVIIRMKNGDLFGASFFAYKSIEVLRQKHLKNGAFLNGNFFWTKGMVLINDCSKKSIQETVQYMIDEGDFSTAFTKFE